MGIIIGLGTGRSGTVSLSKLIHKQPNSVCFHELNPSCMSWEDSIGTVLTMIREFKEIIEGGKRNRLTVDLSIPHRSSPLEKLNQLDNVEFIGEIGFYYLKYVEEILEEFPDVKFPCFRRNKEATINSYYNKMFTKEYVSRLSRVFGKKAPQRNHFVIHDGSKWELDNIWDKCFPKYEVGDLKEAIGEYWEEYYKEAERLAKKHRQLKIFELESFNDNQYQQELLNFCGFKNGETLQIHENKNI